MDWQKVDQWFFPPSCMLCDQDGWGELDICADCWQQLPLNLHYCQHCAQPIQAGLEFCGACLYQPHWINQIIVPYLYQSPIDELIKALKFEKDLAAARLLAQLIYPYVRDQDSGRLLPVPRHASKLRREGFNPSAEICAHLAKALDCAWSTDELIKIKATPDQHQLNFKQRKRNLNGAFAFRPQKKYEQVILVDDVVTTGTTIHKIAALLKRSGIQKISVWAVARTVKF